jgi:hypothetical protein
MDRCGEFVTMETGVERFYDLLTSIWLSGHAPFYHKTCSSMEDKKKGTLLNWISQWLHENKTLFNVKMIKCPLPILNGIFQINCLCLILWSPAVILLYSLHTIFDFVSPEDCIYLIWLLIDQLF